MENNARYAKILLKHDLTTPVSADAPTELVPTAAARSRRSERPAVAAEAAARYNNANRIKDEAELVDFFKAQGLKVITPDVAAFRKTVQEKYLKSDMAKVWPKGLLERINAVQ